MKYLLGIDIGTTATKSAIFSEEGKLIDIESKSYPLFYPEKGWVEQNAEDWWDALIETAGRLVRRNKLDGDIVSISLSTQGGALVLLDKNFNPVYPAVSWMDTRARDTKNELLKNISKSELYRKCGWPIIEGLNFPTIYWFRRKKPEVFKKAVFFASTIDYINKLLTDRFVIDYTNLALTEFLNIEVMGYNEKTLEIAGLDYKNLPEIIPSGEMVGRVKKEVADEIGISRDVTVISGAHDQYCASIGAGATEVGDCILSAGTAWVLLATADKLYFKGEGTESDSIIGSVNPGIHPIRGKYGLMTSVPFGGNALKWYRDTFRSKLTYEELNMEALRVRPCADGLYFIPIMGSRSGRGAFVGIDGIHRIDHFTRAVFEGVAFTNRRHMELIEGSGLKVSRLIMIGGGAKSALWPEIVASVLNKKVFIPEIREAACAGAAVLAGYGMGVFNSIGNGSMLFSGDITVIEPDSDNVNKYNSSFNMFLSLIDVV